VLAFGALTVLLCSGATSPTNCSVGNIGPSSGEIIGAAVGVGVGLAVIVVVVVHVSTNHAVMGCVVTGPGGPELQTSDKRYSLDGDVAGIKVGDRVKISGKHIKKTKDQTGDQVYQVKQLKKDYGPCPVKPAA
jgi:4-hydroxy-3-methylbut-2-en-1-yl diphosphate synthase IspG/GcpE